MSEPWKFLDRYCIECHRNSPLTHGYYCAACRDRIRREELEAHRARQAKAKSSPTAAGVSAPASAALHLDRASETTHPVSHSVTESSGGSSDGTDRSCGGTDRSGQEPARDAVLESPHGDTSPVRAETCKSLSEMGDGELIVHWTEVECEMTARGWTDVSVEDAVERADYLCKRSRCINPAEIQGYCEAHYDQIADEFWSDDCWKEQS